MLFSIIASCNEEKFLTEEARSDVLAENLFNSYTGFFSGMNATYALMRELYTRAPGDGNPMNDILWVINSDNVMTRTNELNQFIATGSGWGPVSYSFEWLYRIINTTNLIINRAENTEGIDWEEESGSTANQMQIIGEARAARAWAYRMLIYAFGPVPLSVEEINGDNFSNGWKRNSIEEIKAQMLEDLTIAANNLPLSSLDQNRITGAYARMLLGELYLSLGQFQNAIDALEPLVNSGEYSLVNSRFGRTASQEDGNLYMDIFRSPYRSEGNTESIFVFSNTPAVEENIVGSRHFALMNTYIGDFRAMQRMERTEEFYGLFGGYSRSRYHNTPFSMSNQEDYERYNRNKDIFTTPLAPGSDEPHNIQEWLWTNTDGRDNFIYEEDDIRGQPEAVRRYFIYDWNYDGDLLDSPAAGLDQVLQDHSENVYDLKDEDGYFIGDTVYTYFSFRTDNGNLRWYNKEYYTYSRKWEVELGFTTGDLSSQGDQHSPVHARLAEAYLLYAEAQFMDGNSDEAATWINRVRERSGASTIVGGDVSLDFILDERSRELIDEELRRITLLRTGKLLERTRKYNPLSNGFLQDHHKLWPFPSSVIITNQDAVLDQNMGYGGSTTADFTPTGYPDEGFN